MPRLRRNKLIVLLALVLTALLCVGYVSDYYRTDTEAVSAFALTQSTVIYTEQTDEGTRVYKPENPVAGLIFYPGGKVEYTAYEPLMRECAAKGILCVLVKMPLNLAVLDVSAADGVREAYTDIDRWYIGGHSLGGSMAASYIGEHADSFEGLVLLGSYSTADLSSGDVDVLSVYGSEDRVMNAEKYEKYKSNLPEGFTEYVLEGGCHAFFGMYGEQDGDGEAEITNIKQIKLTAEKIADFVGLE